MESRLNHGLDLQKSSGNHARERFASSLRAYVLVSLAGELRADYEQNALPAAKEAGEPVPVDGEGVHNLLKGRDVFNLYSSLRCTAQEMVWNSVLDSVNGNAAELENAFSATTGSAEKLGSLELDPTLDTPRYVSAIDVHLMPGNYDGRENDKSMLAGAMYDNGLNVFAMGVMGKELNDIGWSMANFLRHRFPDVSPARILDAGCTIGHNTLPWKQTFPDAEVHGVDVAGPCLRYAHARAESLGIAAHFHQQPAEALGFDDASFDVVFSSMFLHELPLKSIRAFLAEAYRVLKPGGIMLHMELPPNDALAPYDAFYLDWDGDYNNEPYYKTFRDQNYRELCATAGFADDAFFETVMPRYTYVAEADFAAAIGKDATFDEDTGRLSDVIEWYGFGARKSS